MVGVQHRIRRQVWQVHTASQADAFVMRAQFRAAWETFLPVFEAAFDRVATDQTVRVRQLRLRLRVAPATDWRHWNAAALESELRSALEVVVQSAADPTCHETTALTDWDILYHYLTTGALHWSLLDGDASGSAQTLQLRTIADRCLIAALESRVAAPDVEMYCFRLLQLLSAVEPAILTKRIAPHVTPRVRAALDILLTGDADTPMSQYSRLRTAAAVLSNADCVADGAVADPNALTRLKELFPFWPSLTAVCASATPRDVEQRSANEPAPARTAQAVADSGVPVAADFHDVDSATASPELRNDELAITGTLDANVLHAGIILLHPFLSSLFGRAGLLSESAFLPNTLPRAAALLHFVATGREDLHEFELGLIKVLLGVDPDRGLAVARGLLTNHDREEARGLLAAAIQHWSVLKETSIEGLRTSFLQRGGLLSKLDFGWRLRVQPAAYDLLLNHLPWGLSVVMLPWMPEPLHVEWRTP